MTVQYSLARQIFNIPSVKQKLASRLRSVSAKERACIEEERGLSELVFQCLGLPLDKTYQISDWERRPLSDDQLLYAGIFSFICSVVAYVCCSLRNNPTFEVLLTIKLQVQLVGYLRHDFYTNNSSSRHHTLKVQSISVNSDYQ